MARRSFRGTAMLGVSRSPARPTERAGLSLSGGRGDSELGWHWGDAIELIHLVFS